MPWNIVFPNLVLMPWYVKFRSLTYKNFTHADAGVAKQL